MRIVLLSLAVSLSAAGIAAAQVSPPVLAEPRAGVTDVQGACVDKTDVRLTVTINSKTITLPDVPCTNGRFTVDISAVRLQVGSVLSAAPVVNKQAGSPAAVTVMRDGPFGDEREDFESSAYVGIAIDRFAAQEIQKYLNPEANGVRHERSIFGVDFEYRLGSRRDRDRAPQLWVYGETLHGVRSEDIDCKAAPNVPSCKDSLAGFGTNIPPNALYMLRNASSLEAFVGARLEFLGLNLPGGNPARVYVKGQFGFVELTKSDGDAKDMHHVAIGAITVGGARAGSYLEVGYGRTDLFLVNRRKRIKIDGHFEQAVGGGVSLFAQLFADVDGRNGADAMQSYFGLSFDVGEVVGAIAERAR